MVNIMAIIKRCVDAAMYILFLLLMGQCVLRGVVHEWLGISAGLLFLVHNALNFRWYQSLLMGRYNPTRIVQLVINGLLIITVLACMVSGILVSQHIFSVGSGSTIELGRHLHLVATAWAFILISIHLGLHRSAFANKLEKIKAGEKTKKAMRVVCRVIVVAICAYGLYQFLDRRFWEELFHLIDYQKEYDYSKSLLTYSMGTAALSVAFITIACCAKKLLFNSNRQRGDQNGY